MSGYGQTPTGLTPMMPAQCAQLDPDWQGPRHKGHAKCIRAAKRLAARRRAEQAEQDRSDGDG